MKITNIENGKIRIDTPYNPEFVAKVKTAGARWNPTVKAWEADERSAETVREIMREVYGQDDLPVELVDVVVTLTGSIWSDRAPVTLFGRTIATAWGRDSGARVGDKVSFSKGGADSGGSAKNWLTIVKEGSVFTIYDVARSAVESKIGWQDDSYGTYEIREKADPKKALKEEKEALLKRLAEIEKLLAE